MKGTTFDSHKGLFYIDILDDKKIKVNELLLYKYEHIYEQYQTAMHSNGADSELSSHSHVARWKYDFVEIANLKDNLLIWQKKMNKILGIKWIAIYSQLRMFV